MRAKFWLLAMALTLTAAAVFADDEEINGYSEYEGYSIVSPADYPPVAYPGDAGPMQTFEIVRPDARAITLSRLITTCECIQLEADQAEFADGERAFVRLRNVKPTEGKNYVFYVRISSPETVTLQHETYVVSDYPPPPES